MPRSTRIAHAAAALTFLLPAASAQAAGWTPAVPLPGAAASSAGAPQVAAAPAGAVTVAWASGGVVYVSDRAADGSFGAPRAVSGAGVQGDPVLAVGAGGRAVLAWVRGGLVEASVRAGAGAAFDAPAALSGADPADLSVAVGPDGVAAVAWVRGSLVQIAERGAAQAAWPASVQTFTEDRPGKTAIAAGADGRLTAVWSAFAGGIEPLQRHASRPAPGAAWSAPHSGARVAGDTMGPVPVEALADASGAVTALWVSRTGAGSDGYSIGHPVIAAGRSAAGGAFGGGSVSDGPTNENGWLPDFALAVAASGDAAAIWLQAGRFGEYEAVPAVALRAGSDGAWGAPRPLEDTALAEPNTRVDVALDPQGRPVAVWERRDGTIAGDRSAGGWAGATAISAAGADDPQVAVDAAGNGVAVWRRSGRLETATYDVRPAQPEPQQPQPQPDGPRTPQTPGTPGGGQPPRGTTGTSAPRATGPRTTSPVTAPLRLTGLTLSPKRVRAHRPATLTLRVGGRATLTIRVERRTGRKWRTTRTLTRRATKAGAVKIKLPRTALRAKGGYRVTVAAGKVTATKRFRVR